MVELNGRSRREYLLLAGSVTTFGIAGCTGDGTDSEPATEAGGGDNAESGDADEPNPRNGGGMGGGDESESTDGTDSGGGTNTDQSEPAKTVDVLSNEFAPPVATIDAGETVEWSLEEGSHTVTLYHRENGAAEHRVPDGVMAFDDALEDGSFQWTFDTEGVYDYYCRPHEAGGMVGTVVVGEPESDEAGLTSPSSLAAGAADKITELNGITRDEFGLQQSSSDDSTSGTDDSTSDSDDDSGYGGGGYGY
jgi:plastocyanin